MFRILSLCCVGVLAFTLLTNAASLTLADEVQATIATIEPDDHFLILVNDENNVLSVRFLVGGQVFINDEEMTIWDLEPGDRVTVTYDLEGEAMLATHIDYRR